MNDWIERTLRGLVEREQAIAATVHRNIARRLGMLMHPAEGTAQRHDRCGHLAAPFAGPDRRGYPPSVGWFPAQASRSSTGQVLTTRSSGTPCFAARSHPWGCHSSWPVAWASESIEK